MKFKVNLLYIGVHKLYDKYERKTESVACF